MDVKRKMEMVVKQGTFAELEEADVEFYASLTPSQSVAIVEEMRKMIWHKDYLLPIKNELKWRNLKDEEYDFE